MNMTQRKFNILLLKKTWLKTAQYFIHNSESSPVASLPTLKYLNSMVPMVYILIEFKSSVLTKKEYLEHAKARASTHCEMIRFLFGHYATFQRMRVKDSLHTTSDV